jgi:hypothetical protein
LLNLFNELLDDKWTIYIVTNADHKWVTNCLRHLLPDFNELLEENGIKIYSAKNLFSKNLDIQKWKVSDHKYLHCR